MTKVIFKKGDWAKPGDNRPIKIPSTAMAKLFTKMGCEPSSEAEQKAFDEAVKNKKCRVIH